MAMLYPNLSAAGAKKRIRASTLPSKQRRFPHSPTATSALLALQAPDQLRVDQQSIASPKCVDSGLGSTERSVDRLAPG